MGVSLAALGSGYYALRYRFGASHCLTACSVSLTQAVFGCFTLIFTRISALSCFMFIIRYL
ncbi:MAG: hypothetical protein RML94_04695 [Bacteroidia bacterium]|nr:hypothetical protein [Bacteroidia bacterium]